MEGEELELGSGGGVLNFHDAWSIWAGISKGTNLRHKTVCVYIYIHITHPNNTQAAQARNPQSQRLFDVDITKGLAYITGAHGL